MEKLEKKSIEIQNCMRNSGTHDFDRVSDYNDNGSIPLQGQQDEQSEAVNSAENAPEHDTVDILTGYPSWSTDTNDIHDNNEVTCDNRDRALITQSLSDRLGLGQNSLWGAQQVIVATKHTNQMTHIPEHLRQMSLGEETESTSYEETNRNRNIIPQVDGTVDSRDSLNQTPNSIDLTKSPVKNTKTQKHIEKINEDTSDDDIDEMIKFNKDKASTIYRKDTNEQRKRTKIVKSKKGRTTKVYAINIERKGILKQRREKVLQNARDRKIGKANAQVALQDSIRANRASNDTQNITMIDDAVIGDDNTANAVIGDDNTDNVVTGEASTVQVPLPPRSKGKAKDPSQIKTSSKHATPIAEPSIADPLPDDHATVKASGHTFDLGDVCTYEFLIQGTPNPHDLEGIEEDQLLEIQQNIQDKLKQRDEERERNITKRIKQYKEKYDFINKVLLESVMHITEMTKTDHPTAAAKVNSVDKMVMLPPLFDGSKPEVAKQHYERFNQYIKFQTKSGNIKDPIAEAIELFEHTLDKALVWLQEHKDKFVYVTTLKTMFLQKYNPWVKAKRDQLQSWNILTFDPPKTDVDEHIDLINTLGDMLGQTAESKMEKFVDTMPTIIQHISLLVKIGQRLPRKQKS